MKTIDEINAARTVLGKKLQIEGLSDVQKALFAGMLNSLVWVANGPSGSTMDRLLSDEPVAAGKDHTDAIQRLRSIETPKPKIFTVGEVAKILKVAPRTVSRWYDSGRLRGYRIPGSQDRRIPREYLLQFLKENGLPLGDLENQAP